MIGSSLITGGSAQKVGLAQKKRASTPVFNMRSQATGSLSVSLSGVPDGARMTGSSAAQNSLDLGSVSYAGHPMSANVDVQRSAGRFVVSTRFAMVVNGESHIPAATVLAALAAPEPVFIVRIDGVKLGTTPQLIQGQARIGVTTQHRLEIEVPTSVTEKNSQLHNSIVFQVIAN